MPSLHELTDDQARSLAGLLAACRPYGARRWDRGETLAALRRVQQLKLADVVLAFTRAADDRHCDSPFAVTSLNSPHWRERTGIPLDAPRRPDNAPAHQRCSTCQLPEAEHQRRWATDHPYAPNVRAELDDTARDYIAAARAGINTTDHHDQEPQ